MSGNKQPHSVLVVIHTAALDVLLLERAAHPGYWQSVTGSREGEETAQATACREVGEETGLRITSAELLDWKLRNRYRIFPEWRHRYPEGVEFNEETVFSLSLPEQTKITLAPAEHRQAIWLPWCEAAEQCFSWSNRDAILSLPLRAPSL
jgi:dATP pyrophosphohydrolase